MSNQTRITKGQFKKELSNAGEQIVLRFEQLCNEFPMYSATIMKAFAEVAASRV